MSQQERNPVSPVSSGRPDPTAYEVKKYEDLPHKHNFKLVINKRGEPLALTCPDCGNTWSIRKSTGRANG